MISCPGSGKNWGRMVRTGPAPHKKPTLHQKIKWYLLLALGGYGLAGCYLSPGNGLTFDFEYQVVLQEAGQLEAWVPVPSSDDQQRIQNLSIATSLEHRLVTDSLYGNRILFLKGTLAATPETLRVNFRVTRQEAAPTPPAGGLTAGEREKFLAPLVLVPRDARFHKLADSIAATGQPFPAGVYRYILEHMEYDKSGSGWGRGDAVYACDIGKGNCTDYHSLFNAIVRARDIPARFKIGFPLPPGDAGVIPGYHCWTEYYDPREGWVPVDISEADQHPVQREYYHGHLDPRRVNFSVGRDIPLPGGTAADRANYLIYPYVKINARKSTAFSTQAWFKVVS